MNYDLPDLVVTAVISVVLGFAIGISVPQNRPEHTMTERYYLAELVEVARGTTGGPTLRAAKEWAELKARGDKK